VYYFYNSTHIPSRTQLLFTRASNPVIPLQIDIGPQAIAGSTRLQGATLAEAGLGALLGGVFYLNRKETHSAMTYPERLLANMQRGLILIRQHLKKIVDFAKKEKKIFSDLYSNFYQLKDVTDQGYVTFITSETSMREVLIDATEISPTFSTNPIRRENEEYKKRAEFRAYLVGKETNHEAWKALLGRDPHTADIQDIETFLLACGVEGINSYQRRPVGKGNFLIGVAKVNENQFIPGNLLSLLAQAKGETGLLLTCRGQLIESQKRELEDFDGVILILEDVPHDEIGFAETIVLKQTLNLISNASMVLMNKVHGNQMIDVRASNRKLIDRCMRLIKTIWSEYQSALELTDKELYHYVAHVSTIKKSYEEKGIYSPSVVKIILAMFALEKTPEQFQEVIDFLKEKQERVDWIKQEV